MEFALTSITAGCFAWLWLKTEKTIQNIFKTSEELTPGSYVKIRGKAISLLDSSMGFQYKALPGNSVYHHVSQCHHVLRFNPFTKLWDSLMIPLKDSISSVPFKLETQSGKKVNVGNLGAASFVDTVALSNEYFPSYKIQQNDHIIYPLISGTTSSSEDLGLQRVERIVPVSLPAPITIFGHADVSDEGAVTITQKFSSKNTISLWHKVYAWMAMTFTSLTSTEPFCLILGDGVSESSEYIRLLRRKSSQYVKLFSFMALLAAFFAATRIARMYQIWTMRKMMREARKTTSIPPAESGCIICCKEDSNIVLLPCKHLVLCSECWNSLAFSSQSQDIVCCPVCRVPVESLIKVFR